MLTVLFFARLREVAGTPRLHLDDLALPLALADVIKQLRARDGALAAALATDRPLRAALNQRMLALDETAVLVQDGDELAFFPPVTGG